MIVAALFTLIGFLAGVIPCISIARSERRHDARIAKIMRGEMV